MFSFLSVQYFKNNKIINNCNNKKIERLTSRSYIRKVKKRKITQ